ncbi:SanA/YdcF family protein [Demequina iriomotensis]|uniref:SanA/YdcF family protein n=1 Tax=Demequina iriomotensis TaxID=1536641 RepID=UPI000783B80A|nr:ElyC/SanA/YdcF family protein [Demequina iriomotensis]
MARARLDPRHRWKVAALVAIPSLLAAPWVVVTAQTSAAVRPAAATGFAHADAALVLGAGVRADGSPSPFLLDRVTVAAELYRSGAVDTLLMSGDGEDSSGFGEPTVMRGLAESMGVPAEAIVEDPLGLDTYSSCVRAHDEYGLGSVIVATQQFHQARAVWLCDQVGMDAQGAYPSPTATRHTLLGHVREVPAIAKSMVDLARGRAPEAG